MRADIPTAEEQWQELSRNAVDLISKKELIDKINKKKKIKVKFGADPSRPDLHLGHTVVINKLKKFQEFGHEIIFIIGDFTATIGDPTGKNETRPPLTREEVTLYSKSYAEQVFKILDPEKTKVAYNSSWLDTLTPRDLIYWTAQTTVAQMLERDDFSKRYQSQTPISLHEFLYPIFQGYDSVAIESDIELGGTDQLFNLLVGRNLQKAKGQDTQCVLTMPILEGTDGVQKMSKSLDNYIGITDAPNDMFGKVMRISDDLMFRYFELLSQKSASEIYQLKTSVSQKQANPRDVKFELGRELVARYHSQADADRAQEHFLKVFSQKEVPTEIPVHKISKAAYAAEIDWPKLLVQVGLTQTTSEARRLIEQGALEVNSEKYQKIKTPFVAGPLVIKAGKRRFARVEWES